MAHAQLLVATEVFCGNKQLRAMLLINCSGENSLEYNNVWLESSNINKSVSFYLSQSHILHGTSSQVSTT